MLAALSRPSLTFRDVVDVCFLSQSSPTNSVMLRGAVSLHLPKAKKVTRLVVELIGISVMSLPDYPVERLEIFNRSCSLDLSEETLQAGDHAFRWEIEVPANAAPSVTTKYGKVMHQVRATASGASWSGGDLHVEREIELISTPTLDDAPPPHEMMVYEETEETGSFAILEASPSLCVGGCLYLDFSLGQMRSRGSIIHELTYNLREHVELRTLSRVHREPTTDHQLRKMAGLNSNKVISEPRMVTGAPLCPPEKSDIVVTRQENGSMNIDTVNPKRPELNNWSRLPSHSEIRPSTGPDVDTPVRIKHELVWRIIYANAQGQGREIVIKRDITIGSCRSLVESLRLPRYSPAPGGPALRKGVNCCCSQSLTELYKEHQAAMDSVAARYAGENFPGPVRVDNEAAAEQARKP